MITNYPSTGTANVFTNQVVDSGMQHFVGSRLVRMLTTQESVANNVEQAFQVGTTVNVRVKPFRSGQVLTDMTNNLTTSALQYGNVPVQLEYVFGDSISLAPADQIALNDGGLNAMTEATELAIQGALNRYESTMVGNIRTVAGVQSNLGTSGNAITFATIQATRTNNPELPASHEINILCDAGTFGEISRLSEVIDMQKLTSASEYVPGEIYLGGALNIRIMQHKDYTAKVGATDPKFTAFAAGSFIAPLRTSGVIDPANQRLVTVPDQQIAILLSMSSTRLAGSHSRVIDSQVLSGFNKFTPQMTSGSTTLGKYFIQHCVGGL